MFVSIETSKSGFILKGMFTAASITITAVPSTVALNVLVHRFQQKLENHLLHFASLLHFGCIVVGPLYNIILALSAM